MERFLVSAAGLLVLAACQPRTPEASKADSANPAATAAVGTTEWKIQTYTSAAPPTIAANASVLDWNDSLKAPATEIRKGSNGWTCMPLAPPPAGGYTTGTQASPMCGDSMTMLWGQGYLSKTKPRNTSMGIAYMLHGDIGTSNSDPYATSPSGKSDWVVSGPHIMVLPADPKAVAAVSTDYRSGQPFQMWKGTPYAHIMVPVSGSEMQH